MILATRLLNFIERSNLDKHGSRPSKYGAWSAFQNDTNRDGGIVNPGLQARAIQAIGSTLQTPAINYDGTISIRSTRPITIPMHESTSELVTITFTTYAFGIREYPALYVNNYLTAQEDFNNKYRQRIYAMGNAVDTACLTAMSAGKTQVLSDTLGDRYALVGNVVEAPLAEKEAFVGDINMMQAGNDFYGNPMVIGNNSMHSLVRNTLKEQGEFNERNKTYQYDDKEWYFTNRLTNAAGHTATAYAVEPGSLGFLYQFEPDALLGTTTSNHKWDRGMLPLLNMPVSLYEYDGVENATAAGTNVAGAAGVALERTAYRAYDFAGIFAFITAHNSAPTTRSGPIMKVALKAT